MKTILHHPFKDTVPNVDEFLKNSDGTIICTINEFCYRVTKLSEKYALQRDPEKFKGDAFELLVEHLIKTNGADNRIGIYDYHPITDFDQEDVGVDGVGKGENTFPATIQAKFRAGNYILSANEDGLSNFLAASWFDFKVRMEDDKNMIIITTGLRVAESTLEKMLKGKVRVLNREALSSMLDNRTSWWTQFYESIKASRLAKQVAIPFTLRNHQIETLTNISGKSGKVILPTGTGKTLVEAEEIRREIENCKKQNIPCIIKVNSPRILLCFQLFEEVFKYLNSFGVTARYVNYNTGNNSDKEYVEELSKIGGLYRNITSSTSIEELKEADKKAKKENIPLIVFSTYHSAEKFAESGIVPCLTIHDEAHNLVSSEFNIVAKLPSERNLFFTATEKITDSEEDIGMNNSNIFGNLLYKKTAKEMISIGEMVTPMIHVVKADASQTVDLNKLERDYEALFHSIIDAFSKHQLKVDEFSFDSTQIGAKVLVVCRGQKDLEEMFNTNIFKMFREQRPDIHIFALSSDFGLYSDGEYYKAPVTNIKKFKFIKKLKNLKPEDKCIIFHVDMIGEGIDVPGITGVMPFRNCELCKFIQNIGRASRLHKEDRKKLYSNNITHDDKNKWIKPCSWVIIPSFLENSEGWASRAREIIQKLRSEFGWIPQQNVVVDNVRGIDDTVDIDIVNPPIRIKGSAKSGLENFWHEYEGLTEIEKAIVDADAEQMMNQLNSTLFNIMSGNQ